MQGLISTTGTDGAVDTQELRTVFGQYPSGVTAVCSVSADGTPRGMAASSFVGVSLDPPLVGVCVQYTSSTWPQLRDHPRLGLSVLGDGQDRACRQLASKTGDRFADLDWESTEEGALLLHGATAWLDCSVERSVPAGDHEFVLFRVHRHRTHDQQGPLVFHDSGFHALAGLERAS